MNQLARPPRLRRPYRDAIVAMPEVTVDISSAPSAADRSSWIADKVASTRLAAFLEQRQCAAHEMMRLASGNPELEEKAVVELEAIGRDWKHEYLLVRRSRAQSGRTLRIRTRRPMRRRARRPRRARRTQRSRRAQSDSGGSDGDGPDGDPAGSSPEPYEVATSGARRTRDRNSTAGFGERAHVQKLEPTSWGRGPWPESAPIVLTLRRATSEALPSEAGPRSGRRGAR